MLQGVVQHGTAHAMSDLAPYVAGKTGTSEDENDAWFVGFTNDVTVAVWVGYDNGAGKRRTLGSGSTGAHVALPIFEPIIEAAWAEGRPKEPLASPSPQARRLLAGVQADRPRRERSRSRVLVEYLRKDSRGEPIDARNALLATRTEKRAGRTHSRSPDRSVSRSREANGGSARSNNDAVGRSYSDPGGRGYNETTGRGFFGAQGGPFAQPGQPQPLGARPSLPPQWRDGAPRPGRTTPFSEGRSFSNGGFFGFPFGRD
jgi:membrane peptidoglycan carboxypeptidase